MNKSLLQPVFHGWEKSDMSDGRKIDIDDGAAADPRTEVADAMEHIRGLLHSPKSPELTPRLEAVPSLPEIHNYILEIRRQLASCAKGNFSGEISMRGVLAGTVKSLQANMRHLLWQIEQVESGDLSQRVDFMGEFSAAFNNMVQRLNNALAALRRKEEELVGIAGELKLEVEKRGAALAALRKSEESFKYLAEHDPLTGLLNRRSFFARADMELARNSLMDQYSAIALMDVDHFKAFNDAHGHPNGDIALRHIAGIGRATLRDGDIMGRYGGEEFIFFFSKANREQGMHIAERIRERIGESPVSLPSGDMPVTASLGVVSVPPFLSVPPEFNTLEFAVGLADTCLYKAKSEGRNRVSAGLFPDSLPSSGDSYLLSGSA